MSIKPLLSLTIVPPATISAQAPWQHKNVGAAPKHGGDPNESMSGGVLLSHAVPRAVPSALKSLTSGFGMGRGVSPSPWPPKHYGDVRPPWGVRSIHSRLPAADRTSGTAQWTRTGSWELPPRHKECRSQ